MKRIDDKIKEIEKKDKTSRWLYYVIIAGVLGFLAYASTTRKAMDLKDAQIDELTIKNSDTYKELENTYVELENSLKPEEYWDFVENENTVEGYINFITNNWGIDKSKYIDNAVANLKLKNGNKPTGFDGWVFVGSKNNSGEYKSGNSSGKKTVEIIHRLNKETKTNMIDSMPNLINTEPKIGDVVRLVGTRNRVTYSSKYKVGNRDYNNEQGFRNRTKAIVVDHHEDSSNSNFYVEILYY